MNKGLTENLRPPPDKARAGIWRSILLLAAGALSVGMVACASVDPPATGSVASHVVAEHAPSAALNPERKRLIEAFGGEYSAPTTQAYLNAILLKLAPTSNGSAQSYRIVLLNSPVVNAFALPSGDIFVTRGLLALAEDTSEIAAVMAHEIAHVTARHAAQRAEFEKTAALFSRVNAQVLEHPQADDEVQARSKLSIASFSRQQEFEADQMGIKNLGEAGYDPYGAARFLAVLGEWSALKASISGAGSADRPDMAATHPSTPERVAQAEAEARRIGPPETGETGRDAFLTAINGLAFGDDPSQGVVRGTAFIHPKLGFAFEAPEGFTLENKPSALIGVGEAGSQALRLDSIAITDSTPVASAITSGWIDGLKTTQVETMQIGGLEAATAVAQGDHWSFRLGAIRLNRRLYRLIFAAHTLSPGVDQRFLDSLKSFHIVNARDSALAAAQSIKIVTAGSVDTPDTMEARMAFMPQALDQFLILNGLERGVHLVAGQRYKVVAE